jgi:hypothetical protein
MGVHIRYLHSLRLLYILGSKDDGSTTQAAVYLQVEILSKSGKQGINPPTPAGALPYNPAWHVSITTECDIQKVQSVIRDRSHLLPTVLFTVTVQGKLPAEYTTKKVKWKESG